MAAVRSGRTVPIPDKQIKTFRDFTVKPLDTLDTMKLNTVSARICGGGILCTILLLWAVGLVSPVTAAPTEEFAEASETVERLHQKLLEVMQQSDTLGYQARFNQLAPVISSLFDTPLIVKVILRR